MRLLLAGGGTAGHVNPLLATATELQRRDPNGQIVVLGTAEGLEADLVPSANFDLVTIPKAHLPRRPSPDLLALPGRLWAAVAGAGQAIDNLAADAVIGFGGYVAGAAYLAARRRHCPIVVHEANFRPGLANRLGARWAAAAAVAIPGTELRGAQLTGLPLRGELTSGLCGCGPAAPEAADHTGHAAAARLRLGLEPERPVLLVTGGSLGAAKINQAVAATAVDLLATGFQVLHLTGQGKDEAVRQIVNLPGYHIRPYLEAMALAYQAADLVICRAGAGTVCEIAAAGCPAIMVPLPHGNGEQRHNAAHLVEAGAARLAEDAAFTPAWIRSAVLPLMRDPIALVTMAAAARAVGHPDGAARLADLIGAVVASDPVPSRLGGSATDWPPGRLHLLGIGGVGMAAVAELLHAAGHSVSGSDAADSPMLTHLRSQGIDAQAGHDPARVDGAALIIHSTAIRSTNPELSRANQLGLPVLHRAQALARLANAKRLVAVAGAHGKTTTTAMLAVALEQAGYQPSYAIGGNLAGRSDGAKAGAGPFMVIEADESDGSFLNYFPEVAVVTNIEPDHLDHYGTTEAVAAAFADFASQVSGLLVTCADDLGSAALAATVRATGSPVITYGFGAAADINLEMSPGRLEVNLIGLSDGPVKIILNQPGEHVALNAVAAYLAAVCGLGLAGPAIADGLATFAGTERRFEDRGQAGGVRVIDDYAHHPTEIRALLRAARQVSDGRLIVLFQPHLYSRTRDFAANFARELTAADLTVLLDVYPAREDPIDGVSGAMIAQLMPTDQVRYEPDKAAAVVAVAAAARPGDLILTVGAGDVTALGPEIVAALSAREVTP